MRLAGDNRNTLVSVFAQLVARVRPPAFVFENVEGMLTTEKGQRIDDLLGPLVAGGYRVHLRKVNAANYGVPQHRKRVVAIGGLGFDPTFPEPTRSAFGAPGATLAATHLPLAETGERRYWIAPCAVRRGTWLSRGSLLSCDRPCASREDGRTFARADYARSSGGVLASELPSSGTSSGSRWHAERAPWRTARGNASTKGGRAVEGNHGRGLLASSCILPKTGS